MRHSPLLARLPGPALAIAALLLLVANLWSGSLVNSDDAIYASMAQGAFERAEWFDLRWHGAVLHEKPPMFFWLVAGMGALFGFNDFAVRLPGALAGFGVLLLVVSVARRLGYGRDRALFAAALCLASGCFFFTARRVMTDMPLLFWGLLSLDQWLAGRQKPRRLLLWGAALGAAVLTKWLAALPFVLLVVADGLCDGRGAFWRHRATRGWLLAGAAVALLIAAPWHVRQMLVHGAEFWRVYFGYHVIERATGGLVEASSPLYYLVGARHREGALLLLWGGGAGVLVHRLVVRRGRDSGAWWLLAWLAITLVPIHLAGTRLYHYLLPAVPALSLLVARALPEPRTAPARRLLMGFGLAFLALTFISNNGRDWAWPDYSAGTRQLAPELAALSDGAVVAVINDYDVAATWYSGRPVPLWTTSPDLARAWSVDMMVRAGAVELFTPEELRKRLAGAGEIALLAPEVLLAELRTLVRGAGRPAPRVARAQDKVLLITLPSRGRLGSDG